MVKKIIVSLFITNIILFASENKELNIYENNCTPCHKNLSIGIDKIFFRYLLKYSSEISVKSALIDFLKNPNLATSAMSKEQIRRLGIKAKTVLSEDEIKEAIDIYWDKYQVFEKVW